MSKKVSILAIASGAFALIMGIFCGMYKLLTDIAYIFESIYAFLVVGGNLLLLVSAVTSIVFGILGLTKVLKKELLAKLFMFLVAGFALLVFVGSLLIFGFDVRFLINVLVLVAVAVVSVVKFKKA